MRIEENSQPYMMSYFAEGAIEKASPQLSIAYVVGHELGHASTNRMLAISKGEEVEQNITYRVVLKNGRLVAEGGITEATFKKKVDSGKGSESVGQNIDKKNQQPGHAQNTPVLYGRQIQSLKVKKEELEQKLIDIRYQAAGAGNKEQRPDTDDSDGDMEYPASDAQQIKPDNQYIQPRYQSPELSLKDYMKEMEQEKLKREIKNLEREIKELKTDEDSSRWSVTGVQKEPTTAYRSPTTESDRRPLTTDQNTTLKGLIFMDSFRFVEKEIPHVVFIDGGASAIRVRDALDRIIDEKDRKEPLIMQRLRLNTAFYKTESSTWGMLGGYLTDLYKSNAPLLDAEGFNTNAAASSDESILTAAASSNAVSGTYKIKVNQLAKSHQIASDVFSDTGAALNLSGTININDFDVSIEKTDSLYTIADKINYGEDINRNGALDFGTEIDANKNRQADPGEDSNHNGMLDTREDINFNNSLDGGTAKHGVEASLAGGRLVLTAVDTGKPIALKDDNEVLKGLGILSYDTYPLNVTFKHEIQAAQKSKITVDSVEYEKDSNEISDVISGVTISLKDISASEITLTVSQSVDAALSNITDLVNDYNNTMEFLNDQISFAKTFYEDITAQGIRTDLKHNLTDSVQGQASDFDNIADIGIGLKNTDKNNLTELSIMNIFKNIKNEFKKGLSMPLRGSGSIFSSIEDLGIRTKDDDTLEIDEEKLRTILQTNSADVASMFNSENGISGRLKNQLDRELDERLGTIVFRKAVLGDTVGNLDYFLRLQEFKRTLNIINERGRLISSNLSVVT